MYLEPEKKEQVNSLPATIGAFEHARSSSYNGNGTTTEDTSNVDEIADGNTNQDSSKESETLIASGHANRESSRYPEISKTTNQAKLLCVKAFNT